MYQQEIDPDMVVTIVRKNPRTKAIETFTTTNRELMEVGNAPYIMKDGVQTRLELHHQQQNAQGPLFEISEVSHRAKTNQGGEALHPYKTNRGRELNGDGSGPKRSQHPTHPIDRSKFDVDRSNYWQQRLIQLLENKGL